MNENRFFLWTKILIKIKTRDKKMFIKKIRGWGAIFIFHEGKLPPGKMVPRKIEPPKNCPSPHPPKKKTEKKRKLSPEKITS